MDTPEEGVDSPEEGMDYRRSATWMQLSLGVGMMMDSDYGRDCL